MTIHDNFSPEDLESEEFFSLQDDYEESENPDAEVRKLAKNAANTFLKAFPVWNRIRFYYSDDIDEDLGRMRSETESDPIMILSPANIVNASEEYNVPIELTVSTTIYHEMGHALVQVAEATDYDLEFDDEEEFVEEFADNFYYGRPNPILEDFVEKLFKTKASLKPQPNRTLIAALKTIIAKESKEWFEKPIPKTNFKSESLDYAFDDIYESNLAEKEMYDEIETNMKAEGLDPFDEKNSEEYYAWREELEQYLSTNRLFKEPKMLRDVKVIHFTTADPEKLIKAIKDKKFDGCDGGDMGVTIHFGCEGGPLGFGYLAGTKTSSHYGQHAIEFTASEAIEVYHDSDSEKQIIWDSNFVEDLKVIK